MFNGPRSKRALMSLDAYLESPRRPIVCVVGVFRSGTNLLKTVLETHYDVTVVFSKWFWKHGLPPTGEISPWQLARPVPMIVVSKDPVAVNLSLHRFWQKTRPELAVPDDLSAFIRSRFVVYDNSFRPTGPHMTFSTPTEYWNQFHYAYLNWPRAQDGISVLRYEDLAADTDRAVRALGDRYGLRRRSTGPIALPRSEAMPSSDAGAARAGAAWTPRIQTIAPSDAAQIHSLVLPEVARKLGYEMPAPTGPQGKET